MPSGTTKTPDTTPPLGLRRSLGLLHVVLYGLGVTIGAGIYVLIAASASRAGIHAPIAFVMTALLIGLTGASLAEFGIRMPVAAGEAAYVRRGFGSDRMARVVGLLVIAVALVSASTISVGAAGYIGVFVPWPDEIIIALVVLVMGWIAGWGVKESVSFAGIMTVIELGGLVTVIAAGLISEPKVVTDLPSILPLTASLDVWSGIAAAAMLAVFAFIGFEGIVNMAEEMDDPARMMPRAIFWTLAITTVLYVLVMWVALAALGVEPLAASKAPLADVFAKLTGLSPRIMSAVAIVATLNGIVFNIILASRVAYGLARDGSLPKAFARLSAKSQTPILGTGAGTIIVLVFALLLPIATLADLSSRIVLVIFALVNLALYRLKLREGAAAPSLPFSVSKWVPLAGFISCSAFILADILAGWER